MANTALLIARHWPEPDSTAAGRRTLDLLAMLQDCGYDIHVASAAESSPFQADLTRLGYQCHRIHLNDSAFDDWINAIEPDLVVFDRFVSEEQFGWRVREQQPQAMTMLDTSDLHCLRHAREISVKKQQPLDLMNDIALREIAAIVRCDLSLMISNVEVMLLQQVFSVPETVLAYLPFLVTPTDRLSGPDYSQRRHIIMMGGFKHEPNRDATRWLRQDIWPQLRANLPTGTEMHVYGAYADHAMMQLHKPELGFHIKGRAEDALATFQQYRINIAPLRFGAGQKGKVLEGWLTGTPTITNAIGAESMLGDLSPGYTLPESAQEFAELTAAIYADAGRWQALVDAGDQILKERFQRDAHVLPLLDQIKRIRSNLTHHRRQNFWGRMLWQQQFRANEFMSRWIETKNRLTRTES